MGDFVLFTLPIGLTVRNSSKIEISAIGKCEYERFQIVITSDDEMIIYELPNDSLDSYGNY